MPKSRVYLETTIVSYLVASPSADLIQAAHQQATRNWWSGRNRFELFISRAVVTEAGRGNPDAAARRMEALQGIPNLQFGRDVAALAKRLMRSAGGTHGAEVMTRRDPVIEEVRKHREAIAREHGNDLDAIIAAFQRQDASDDRATVSFPPKRLVDRRSRSKPTKAQRPNKRLRRTATRQER